MQAYSPWALSATSLDDGAQQAPVYTHTVGGCQFQVHAAADSLLISARWSAASVVFRPAYFPGGGFSVKEVAVQGNGVTLRLLAPMGEVLVTLQFSNEPLPLLHYTTTLTPAAPLLLPAWPRDIAVPGRQSGRVQVQQQGTRTGQLYFTFNDPQRGAAFYFQNLTALAAYNDTTHTSAGDTVGGHWPEIGFALPSTGDKPLAEGQPVVINDAFIVFHPEAPATPEAIAMQYLELLAAIYVQLPKPVTHYHDWPTILQNGLHSLTESHGCWQQMQGQAFMNAYVCDYKTPPEVMVQLAVILPLLDYSRWGDHDIPVIERLRNNLSLFYDPALQTICRWLPAARKMLKGGEEHKAPLVMDAWYLHHPLLNLSRMALQGDELAGKLFLDSLEFAIRVARHFNYSWPVFYRLDTLEVVKAETQPGNGGEKDVAGSYCHIMLQAFQLTGEGRYLEEAEAAALTLQGMGFDLFYQANNTSFAAGALLRLWKLTRKEIYLHLSYTCIANLLRNAHIWTCNYGYGKLFPSFFALFPLNDAPYTAAYEEQEVFCALHEYLQLADGEPIMPAVSLLLAEYIRYLNYRAPYYYPPVLPKEALVTTVKTGELDPNLWIAVEDLQDGWLQSGTVGQEVYAAGNAFGIVPRHYIRIPGRRFLVYTDYPFTRITATEQQLSFRTGGSALLACRMIIMQGDHEPLPSFTIQAGDAAILPVAVHNEGLLEYAVRGAQTILIRW